MSSLTNFTPHETALRGRPPSKRLLVVSSLVALGLHLGISLVFVYLTTLSKEKIEKHIEPKLLRFEDVELLALGEEKPPNQLPQIANPPPKVKRADPVVIEKTTPTPTAEPDPKSRPAVETNSDSQTGKTDIVLDKKQPNKIKDSELLDALSDLHDPERPVNDVIPEGSKDGVAGGTTSDAALANMMNTYQAKLLQELAKTWQLPTTLSPSDITGLAGKVSAYVRLSSSGSIVSYRFRKTSGNQAFDSSIDRVLRRYTVQGGRKLPLPTEEALLKVVLKQGLTLSDWKSIQN